MLPVSRNEWNQGEEILLPNHVWVLGQLDEPVEDWRIPNGRLGMETQLSLVILHYFMNICELFLPKVLYQYFSDRKWNTQHIEQIFKKHSSAHQSFH